MIRVEGPLRSRDDWPGRYELYPIYLYRLLRLQGIVDQNDVGAGFPTVC